MKISGIFEKISLRCSDYKLIIYFTVNSENHNLCFICTPNNHRIIITFRDKQVYFYIFQKKKNSFVALLRSSVRLMEQV
jgi:hypothetical protein